MARTIGQIKEELHAKQDQLFAMFAKHEDVANMSKEEALEAKTRNDELAVLATELKEAEELNSMKTGVRGDVEGRTRPAGASRPFAKSEGGNSEPAERSLRDIISGSREYKSFVETGKGTVSFDLSEAETKTLITLTTINNLATRSPIIQQSPQEERTVADLMLEGSTDNNVLSYYYESTFTNAAAETAEGGTKPESALAFTERTDTVRKIATWIPATDELLADVKGFESYIRGRLMFMVKRREESELLVGDGIAPNIQGILNRTGVQTQAKGADPVPTAVYKAITLVRNTGFAEPTAAVFHPNDWQDIRTLQATTGEYIWGHPAIGGPETIFGLEVRITSAETQNTGLVGAFRPHAQVFRREGITITMSTEHSTYFIENKVAILAEERLALAVYRPSAFCTITGI